MLCHLIQSYIKQMHYQLICLLGLRVTGYLVLLVKEVMLKVITKSAMYEDKDKNGVRCRNRAFLSSL